MANNKYLDSNGLLYFWQKIKNTFAKTTDLPTKTSDLTNDSNYVSDASYVHTDNNYSTTEKNKLSGIASGAEVNVQADWNVTDTSSDAYIKNKPTIPEGVAVDDALSDTSENPVQNKVINTALSAKASNDVFHGVTGTTNTGVRGLVPAPEGTAHPGLTMLAAYGTWARLTLEKNIYEGKQKVVLKSTYKTGTTTTTSATTVVSLDEASAENNGFMSAADKAKLDSLTITNGVLDPSNLPSYVDDVIEAYPVSGATELSSAWLSLTSGGSALTPETGKVYVLMADSTNYATNSQFRWGGSTYVKLSDGAGVSSITNTEIDTIVAS